MAVFVNGLSIQASLGWSSQLALASLVLLVAAGALLWITSVSSPTKSYHCGFALDRGCSGMGFKRVSCYCWRFKRRKHGTTGKAILIIIIMHNYGNMYVGTIGPLLSPPQTDKRTI